MKRCGLLLWLFVALPGCPRSAAGLLEHADRLEAGRHYPQALAAYRDALRRLGDDDSPLARSVRTRTLAHLADLCYLDLGDLRCATEAFRRLLELYPDAPESYQARIHFSELLRDRAGDLQGAIAQLEALVTAYPDRPGADDFQYQAAQGYFDLGDYAQARTEARTLLDRFPHSARVPQARFLLASAFELEGRRGEAIAAYQELIDRTPAGEILPRARLALAKLFEEDGAHRRALALLLACLEDCADPALVQREIARIERELAHARALEHPNAFDRPAIRKPHPHPGVAP